MAKHKSLMDLFSDMSAAIKDKTDTAGKIKLDDFPDKIREIQKPGFVVSVNNFDTPNHILLGVNPIINATVNKYTSVNVSSASSLSSSVTCDVGDLIILCIAVRNPVTSLDSGWTRGNLYRSFPFVYSGNGGTNYTISIYDFDKTSFMLVRGGAYYTNNTNIGGKFTFRYTKTTN